MTVDGRVWEISDGRLRQSGISLQAIRSGAQLDCDAAYLLGDRVNARLITALYKSSQSGGPAVFTCSPARLSRTQLARDPETCLKYAAAYKRCASVGGFREVTYDDWLIYALLLPCTSDKQRAEHVIQHSLWPHLSFIAHLNPARMGALMAQIIDPRWYLNVQKPDNASRLMAWLGLDPYTQRGVLMQGPAGRYHTRCRLVQETWWPATVYGVDPAQVDGQTVIPDRELCEAPGGFVYREWLATCMQRSDVLGVLRASQRLVRYLRFGWMTLASTHPEWVFDPAYFFRHEWEVVAYNQHVQEQV